MSPIKIVTACVLTLAAHAHAQQLPTAGTLVIVPATAEVTRANDMATATFSVEEQDKDKAAAASRVNRKMREGMEILKKADPQAKLKTYGYYTYPVYAEDPAPPRPMGTQKRPTPTMWRVGQSVEFKTTSLAGLAKNVAEGQRILSLNNLHFGLAPQTEKKLDAERIAATYRMLNERVAAIAAAMGRSVNDAVLDTVDFEGSGDYAQQRAGQFEARAMAAPPPPMAASVAEPSFEPGETTLQMTLVGKVRFK